MSIVKKVSVIVPFYNAEDTIRKCLDSVLTQTYKNLEVLCINDGSTDESVKVCEEYKNMDKRISLLHKKNGGVSSARNMGIRHATGDYVAFVDQDDWLEPEMIAEVVAKMETHAADIGVSGFVIEKGTDINMRENRKPVKELFSTTELIKYAFERESYHAITAWVWNKVYKKSFLDNNNILFNEELAVGEDVDFIVRLAVNPGRVIYSEKKRYHHVTREGDSLSKRYYPVEDGRVKAYELAIRLLEDKGYDEENIIIWLKCAYTYHASNYVERAILEKDYENALRHMNDIRIYLREYRLINQDKDLRLKRIQDLLDKEQTLYEKYGSIHGEKLQ